MNAVGHNHEQDGKMYGNCAGCIEERWLALRLKGMTKAEADEQIRNELRERGYNPDSITVRQLSA